MRLQSITPAALTAAVCLVGADWLGAQQPAAADTNADRPVSNQQTIAQGERTYARACVLCHGNAGKGDGPVAFFLNREYAPQPRDFTEGRFKFRSTPSGQPATDEDLFRVVTRGIPGFMPGFAGLSPAERWEVIYYLKTFMPERARAAVLQPIAITGGPLPMSEASVRRGHDLYQQLQCWQCHGAGGRGDGSKASDLEDDWGFRIRPADLTRPSAFKNGARPEDIYRTIATGLDGTPMASFLDVMRGREAQIWDLVNFVRSLSEEGSGR